MYESSVVDKVNSKDGSPSTAQEKKDFAGYKLPPQGIMELVQVPPNPVLSISPDRKKILELKRPPPMPPISELARPELKLAGLKIDDKAFSRSRMSYYTELSMVGIEQLLPAEEDQKQKFNNMPSGKWLNSVSYSPKGTKIAFTVRSPGGKNDPPRTASELWIIDLKTNNAKPVLDQGPCQLNTIFQDYTWIDEETVVACCLPSKAQRKPERPIAPLTPIIQDNSEAKVSQAITYQDLLQDDYDEDLFEFYCTSELVVIDLKSSQEVCRSPPRIYTGMARSPDSSHLLVSWMERPFSYVVPCGRFPKRVQVWERDLSFVREIAFLPLAEDIPIEFNSVRKGRRSVRWRPDKDSTLCWAEAQDDGDPKKKANPRDIIYTLDINSTSSDTTPTVLASTQLRYGGISFCDDNLAILYESWWDDRRLVTSVITPNDPESSPRVLYERNFQDVYSDPGQPVSRRTSRGTYVLAKIDGERKLLLSGEGASPKGNQPFLDVLDVDTRKTKRIWQSQAPYYEAFSSILNDQGDQVIHADGMQVMISRETNQEVPQYHLLTFKQQDEEPDVQLMTRFPHPYPHMKEVKKEIIKYKRKDGVDLTGTLYLPVGYDRERDGPLPCLLWAYPEEFKTKDSAGQLRKSPYEFVSLGALSPKLWLAEKYAVLDGPTMPIIAEGEEEPNDTYIEQLTASAEAAVEELVKRGIAKKDSIAVGGHSYGAFMVGNLLAHCPELFACGICRSGAYNRTLTPFGFQAEQRTFWKAPETYIKMSPFAVADKIKKPILLIHGKDDNNSGTHTMQSERFFAALKGQGVPSRLVLLPHEGHGYRAEESVMHCLHEMNQWLEKYCP